MAEKDWNGFKKNGDTYIPNDATARAGLQNKVDKVSGKGLSTNDYSDADKAIVDGVTSGLAGKVDKVTGKGLSTNDYTNADKAVVTTAQDNIKANTKLIKDTVGWSGKNKLPITHGNDNSPGIVFTQKTNNILHIEGTSTAGISYVLNPSVNEKYTAGKYKLSCVITGTVDTSAPMFTRTLYNADGTVKTGDFEVISANETSRTKIAEVTGTDYFGNNRIWIPANRTVNCDVELMIVDPDTLDMSYEPHFGSTAFPRSEQAVLGAKNILPNNATTQTITGITFTVNSDGTVTANGTATALTWLQIWRGKLKKGKYILNGCPQGGTASDTGYRLGFWNETPSSGSVIFVRETGNGVSIEITDETLDYAVYVGIGNTTTVNNLVFKPMLSFDGGEYVPHAMTNKELTDAKIGKFEIKNNTDLNDIIKTGVYICYGRTVTNSPYNATIFTLKVTELSAETAPLSEKFVIQELTQVTGTVGLIYVRRLGGNPATWGSWIKIEGTVVS